MWDGLAEVGYPKERHSGASQGTLFIPQLRSPDTLLRRNSLSARRFEPFQQYRSVHRPEECGLRVQYLKYRYLLRSIAASSFTAVVRFITSVSRSWSIF